MKAADGVRLVVLPDGRGRMVDGIGLEDVDGFKADLGSALCHRFLTDDMDGLAAAYLKQGDGWVGTRTRNAWKLAERLGGDAYRRI